ncbi:hypothetical protein F5880DRAFT_1563822 [Lentinula raphanica]|nr:hypothetical protein F5880DRAFT_1563822 [Lentinula raphanica]
MPIRARRVILALRYLSYLLELPHDHYAHLSLQESSRLREDGERSWLSDLDSWAIQHLPNSSLSLPSLQALTTQSISKLIGDITNCTMTSLQQSIDVSSRLTFLQGRREPHKDGTTSRVASTLRHYLTQVRRPEHRVSLTKLLCGDLTPVTFRASPASTRPLPDQQQRPKFCRACQDPLQPETPQHVLLQCQAIPTILPIQTAFLTSMAQHLPLPHSRTFTDASATFYIKSFVFHWTLVVPSAQYVHDCISLWKEFIGLETDLESEEEEQD